MLKTLFASDVSCRVDPELLALAPFDLSVADHDLDPAAAHPALQPGARGIDPLAHPRHRAGKSIVTDPVSIPNSAARRATIGDPCRLAQGLGWRAAVVDTRAAEPFGLDQRDLFAPFGKCDRQRRASLARPDDDRVPELRSPFIFSFSIQSVSNRTAAP